MSQDKKKPTKKVEISTEVVAPQNNVEMLIQRAIDKNVPVETMERLLALRKELKAEWAKEQFGRAMAGFQKDCPIIRKNKVVYEKDRKTVRYKYAPLDDIVQQVKDVIAKYGLSYTIHTKHSTEQNVHFFISVCRVSHEDGHAEDYEFKVPLGSETYMSDVQKYGARSTFSKRYAFCNAFGILTGDEDTDAVETGEQENSNKEKTKSPTPEQRQKMEIVELVKIISDKKSIECPNDKEGFEEFVKTATDLQLVPKNYRSIIEKLMIVIDRLIKKEEEDKKTAKQAAEIFDGEIVDGPEKSNGRKMMEEGMRQSKEQ